MEMQKPIFRVKIKNIKSLLANCDVTLETLDFGPVTIKGFQIWKSNHIHPRLQEEINITPPTVRSYGKYISTVFFNVAAKWEGLEQGIYTEYHKEISKAGKEVANLDEVNPNDIPF